MIYIFSVKLVQVLNLKSNFSPYRIILNLFDLEMVRQSAKVAKRLGHSVRNHAAKRQQIEEDVKLMVDACPNVHKLNLVLHHKLPVLGMIKIV